MNCVLKNLDDFSPNAFQRRCVDVNLIEEGGLTLHSQISQEPNGKIVRLQFSSKARLDKVIVNGVQADLPKTINELYKVRGVSLSLQNNGLGRTKIKWYGSGARPGLRIFGAELVHNLHEPRS